MATLDKRTGYFVNVMEKVRDPIRTSHWRLRFNVPLIKAQLGPDLMEDISGDDDITVMVKTAKIPKLTVNTAEAWWMGQSVLFTTNTEYEKESTFDVLETADVLGYRFLGKWNQLAHNTDLYRAGAYENSLINPETQRGVNLGSAKYTKNNDGGKSVVRNVGWVFLELYDYTAGEVLLRVDYTNIFPSSLGELNLSHEGSDLGKYQLTMKHDFFRLTLPKSGKIA